MINRFEKRIKHIHPLLILGFCLLITLILTVLLFRNVQQRQIERLNQISENVTNNINARMVRYENSLRHIHAYLKTDPQLSRERFHSYIEQLKTSQSYPGIQGLGLTKRVKQHDLKEYEREVQQEGFPHFKVWPDYLREDYFSIHFLEPFNWRNQRAFGFDMFSQPIRQEAMAKARDLGQTVLTGMIVLVQETNSLTQPGFLIYFPLYQGSEVPPTVKERRDKLLGFVYAPFRSYDFFNEIFANDFSIHQEIEIKIYDGESINKERLLYSNNHFLKNKNTENSHFQKTNVIQLFDNPWTIVTTFRSSYSLFLDQLTPWIIAFSGSLVSLLIFLVFYAARNHTQAMEVSLTRFNALVANLTEGIIIAYPNGDIQLMNKVAAQIYQFDNPDNIVSKRKEFNEIFTFKTLSGEEVPLDKRPIGRVLKGEKYSDYELEFIHTKTGKKLYVSYGGTPIFNKRGSMVLVVVTVKDITYKKNVEIELREALSARDEFMSISSHELKTPLTSLKLKTQLVKRKALKKQELPLEEIAQFADTIDQQVSRLTRLVDDMLDISRLRSGKFSLSKEKVDFCELIHTALEQITPQFMEAGYAIPELKNIEEAHGYWDPLRIEQVINNLLTNAIRYGNKKPVSLEVKTYHNYVQLSVTDGGKGISPDQQQKIFNRFERLTDVHETTGLGLGLFLSQKIIEAHGGKIWVESQVGVGSTFSFTLPLNDSSAV